ncbi:polysaccharide biosynthesis tyrosine autokinase [Ningiella sp. W23]|uniref:polysaccharide biosynthesis tyrosine autokinase n=1 Tax=Ningiella sp. W23 TaxID=3023715 RepID=UPI003757BCA2
MDDKDFQPSPFSLADLISFLWHKKFQLLLSTLLMILLGSYFILNIPKTYIATATLLLEESDNKFTLQADLLSPARKEDKMDTHIEFLRSHQFAKKVVTDLGLEYKLDFWIDTPSAIKLSSDSDTLYDDARAYEEERIKYAASQFQRRLSLRKVTGTSMLRVSFESSSPELSEKIANRIGPAFFDFHKEKNKDKADNASLWLNEQLAVIQRSLKNAEDELQRFLKENGIVDLNSQMELARIEISAINREKLNSDKALLALSSSLQQVEAADGDPDKLSNVDWILQNTLARELRRQRLAERQAFVALTKRYKEKHHAYKAALAKLDQIETKYNALLLELSANLEEAYRVAKQENDELAAQAQLANEAHSALGQHELELDKLKRKLESTQKLYEVFLSRLQETELMKDLGEQDNFHVVDFASRPMSPAKPRISLLMTVLTVLAALLSFSVLLLLHLISDKKTRMIEKLRRLKVPVLATVPREPRPHHGKLTRRLYRQSRKEYIFSESIRSLRSSLMIRSGEKAISTITITRIGESKQASTLPKYLAESFAKQERTLLTDLDFRQPWLAKAYDMPDNHMGIANLIDNQTKFSKCIKVVEKLSLMIMPTGSIKEDPTYYVSKPRFDRVLNRLEKAFDRLILCAPSITQFLDALVIAKNTHGLVLECDIEKTEIADMVDAIRQIKDADIPLLGVVLTKVRGLR